MWGNNRRAFGMMVAILVILLIGIVGAVVIKTSTLSIKTSNDRYLRYQAELLADSAIDYAVLQLQGYNVANDCLEHLDINVTAADGLSTMFVINNTYFYSFKGASPVNCNTQNVLAQNTGRDTTVVIDTIVDLNDTTIATEPIRIYRRTVQKP